jgi:hypothetical protein
MKRDELPSFAEPVNEHLSWSELLGIGIGSPPAPHLYELAYWDKYLAYDQTMLGRDLTSARRSFVLAYGPRGYGQLVDVGIGGGLFCRKMNCNGFDVNPYAVAWLKEAGRWYDPYLTSTVSMSFWDSLEHIVDPEPLLANAMSHVFVSMPIYRDLEHVLASKHFRPGEHVWYFTRRGLTEYMGWRGFDLIGESDFECDLGREDIFSFAFRRRVW